MWDILGSKLERILENICIYILEPPDKVYNLPIKQAGNITFLCMQKKRKKGHVFGWASNNDLSNPAES